MLHGHKKHQQTAPASASRHGESFLCRPTRHIYPSVHEIPPAPHAPQAVWEPQSPASSPPRPESLPEILVLHLASVRIRTLPRPWLCLVPASARAHARHILKAVSSLLSAPPRRSIESRRPPQQFLRSLLRKLSSRNPPTAAQQTLDACANPRTPAEPLC